VLADGYVDVSVQDSFCSGGTCTISIIYDQSPNKNDLVKSPKALWLPNGGDEVNATLASIKINGHTAHGIYVDNSGGSNGVGYRNNATKGLAKNDDAEAMYAVFDAKRYNQWCCFDYGNAEVSGVDDGNATMEAIYFGNSTQWTRGGGNGPWVAADLENGMFEGDSTSASSNTSIDSSWSYLTAMLKGPSGNAMGLKAGNAQSGALQTKWNGKRPPGYSPKKLNGAIILGTGGDGSNNAKGTFFEGAITFGNPPDSVDDQVQANIVAAGYGH
jgi:non-reducing end alpha-L-arabinofuranosidase